MWQSFDSLYTSMPDPCENIARWMDAIYDKPAKWRSTFKGILRKCGPHLFDDHPLAAPVSVSGDDVLQVAVPNDFICNICSMSFELHASLMTHNHKIHQYRNPIRIRITGTQCLKCASQFFTRKRVLQHVAFRSKLCRACISRPCLYRIRTPWMPLP